MPMDADTRRRLRRLVRGLLREQREVQRRMFATQAAALGSLHGIAERLTETLATIQRMHEDMLPLYETLHAIDDVIEEPDPEGS